jgi:gliding motility-associated-like protein
VKPIPVSVAGADIAYCSGLTGTIGTAATTGYSYSWSPTTSLSSGTVANPTVSLTNTGTTPINTTYTVTTTLNGCTSTDAVIVTVNPVPTSTFNQSPNQCLTGNSFNFTNTGSSGAGYTQTWNFGGATTNTSTAVSPTGITYAAAGTYTITHTVTGPGGCVSTTTSSVTVYPLPVVTVTSPTICSGQTATMTASGASTYTWSAGATSAGATATASPTTTTSYTVTGTSTNGCIATAVATVTVTPLPVITVAPITICAGTPGTLTASGAATYSWAAATGLSATTGASVTANPPSTTTYTVTGTSAAGCVGTTTVVVTVNPIPVTTVNSPTICSGQTATLTAAGATTYAWTSGLSATTGTSVTGAPTTTTSYTVTGTSLGCSSTAVATITVNPLPTVTVAPITICSGTSGTLTASGAATYTWANATGLSATAGASVTANPTATTTYTVTGTSAAGCINTATVVVTVTPLPTITVPPITICSGTSGTLTASGAATYTWANATGLSGTTGTSVTANPTATTTYTVTGTSAAGCVNTATVVVSVTPLPTITVAPITICAGASGTMTASGAATYTWANATGLSGTTGTSVTANPSATTTYTVTGTTAGGCVNTTTVVVTVTPLPVITVTNPTICPTQTATLTASGGTTYTWSPGLSSTTGSSVTGSPSSTTSYTVTGTTSGCSSTAVATITIGGSITPTVNSPIICAGQTATLTASNATTFTWTAGLSSTTGATVTGSPATTTSYTVTGNAAGCTGTAVATITVNPLPVVSVPPVTICSGSSGTLTASGAATYSWAPSTGLSATTGTSVTANPTSTTTYTVTGTSAAGCVNTTTVVVTVNPLPTITVAPITICTGIAGTLTASGAATYSWAAATGLSATTGASVSANPAATTTYTVTGTSAAGCVNTASVIVTVNPLPTITVAPITICTGIAGTLTASGANTYSWSPATGLSATTGSSVSANPAATTTYTVTGTAATGCINTTTVVVTVTPPATLAIAKVNVSCFGGSNGSATVTPTGGTTPYTYSWSPSGGSGATASSLTAGTYTVTVTTNNGCVSTTSTTITQPAGMTLTMSAVNATCGAANGQASVAVSGGTAAYTYSWAPSGGTASTATGLLAGSYTVTVTDANSCTSTNSVAVNNALSPSASTTVIANVSCFGGNNGSASVSISGGTSPYTQSWSPSGGTGITASSLAAGTYTVTVTDGNGCIVTANATITEPPLLTASTTTIDATCFGGATGSATVTAGGGTPGYTYSWAPSGGTGVTASSLAAGTYTVTVTDTKGCIRTATAVISQPTIITATTSNTPVSCFGGNNGTASVVAGGGTPAYSYAWAPGGNTNPTASGLTFGTYTVTVTDLNGCIRTASTTITQPTVLAVTTTNVSSTCGLSNASATATATGGTGAYSYSWTPSGGTSASATGLTAGSYTVTVTDVNGCTATSSTTINDLSGLTASITAQTNVSCFGGNNGTVTVTASGSTSPYTYSINGGTTYQASGTFSGLIAGSYTVIAKDANGCTLSVPVIITEPSLLSASATETDVLCFGGATGTATASATGGTPNYTYSWAPSGGTGITANSLTAGTYTVTVTDSKGCIKTATTIVNQPPVMTSTISNTPVSCFGGNNGTASVVAGGGTPGYTYSWAASGGTSDNASNLSAGTYTVTITDLNGCIRTASTIITQPTQVTVSATKADATCGAANGTITATGTGGTPAYTYSINGTTFQAGTSFTSLAAATYTVTVKDANGCTNTSTITINDLSGLVASITTQANVSCFGGNDGSVTVLASGSTGPYTYSNNGGTTFQASGTFSSLTSGSFTVIAKDANGCTVSVPVTITEPTLLTAAITAQTNILCFGNSTGSVTVAGNDGTPTYTYSINGTTFVASGTFSSLAAGAYTITVKDSKGCTTTVPVTITQPPVLAASITSQTNNICFGGAAGSVTVTATGGTVAYAYSLNGGTSQASGSFNNLTAGSYTVTVTDANTCTATVPVIITEPTMVTVTATKADATCGAPNGTVTATGANGTPAYTYSINGTTFQSSTTFTGLAASTYTVTVKDANGCTNTTTISVLDLSGLTASITSQTNVTCNGLANGTVTITASGSTGPYNYALGAGAFGPSGTFNGLAALSYTVTVQDANSCTVTVPVLITQPPVLAGSVSAQTNITCFGANNGTVTVTSSGGTPTYLYSIDGGAFGASATFSGLTPGAHTVSVRDANGCTVTIPVTITEPTALTLATSSVNAICTAANGSATVVASGGTPNYTYAWLPGNQITPTASNITAGNYAVQVTDANGCVQTANVSVGSSPGGTASIASSNNVTCTGALDGNATVTMSAAATPPYTYSWSPSNQNTVTAYNLGPATYTVTVTDGNGCISSTNVTITEPSAITNSFTNTNVSCNAGNNGMSAVNVAGGTPPYSYLWVPTNQTTPTAGGLIAGTYTVTITDANGCIKTATTAITEPVAMGLTETHVDANCNLSNGSATVMVNGGVGPYTYSWSTLPVPQTTATATALAANTYVATVTDANSCSQTISVTVNNLAGPVATVFSSTNVSCNGLCDGNATVTISGGTAPYTYAWTPSGGSLPTATNLCAGTYTLNATDVNGCAASTSVTITEPAVLATTYTSVNPSCFGGSNGSITSATTGGTTPYTYLWSPGSTTTSNLTGLSAGTYMLQVTDENGCLTVTNITLNNPPALTASTTTTNVTCNGLCNGTATVNVLNATGPINYLWTDVNVQTIPTATALCAGTYSVTATDANGCIVTTTATITTPASISVNITALGHVSCYGACDGFATAAVTGGTAPFSYMWAPSGTAGSSVNNLCAANYTVTVTDANGCTASTTVLINQPNPLVASITNTDVTCYGDCDAQATVVYTGGTGPYTFLWSNFQTTPTIDSVCAGLLNVNITDSKGCVASSAAVVEEPTILAVTTTTVNSTCGVANGTACASITGGSPPFIYSWNDPATQANSCATGLNAGVYTISITDSHNCSVTNVANVNDDNAPIVTIPSSTDVTCFGLANGSAQGNITGGVIPYTIGWTPGGQTNTFANNLSGGIYSLIVTDSVGCTGSASVTINEPMQLLSGIVSTINTSCNLGCDGSATVLAGGGTAPYTYLWNDVNTQTTTTANNLCAQAYTVTVTDANGCTASTSTTVTQPSAIAVNVVQSTNVSCNGGSNGSIDVAVTGGSPGYTYDWLPNVGSSSSVTNLAAGTYTLTVTDVRGCAKVITVVISEPTPVVLTPNSNFSTCGNSNGSAGVSVLGGVSPYSYAWSPTPGSTAIITNIPAGVYTVTVTDNNGCISSATSTVADSAGPTIQQPITFTRPSCAELSNGTATVVATGGQPQYSYLWNTTPIQTTQTASALHAGPYQVTVTDQNGCSVTGTVIVTQPQPLTIPLIPIDTICIGQLTQIYGSAQGGTPPYTFTWNPSSVGTGPGLFNVSPVSPTTYTFTVVDANMCVAQPQGFVTVHVNPQITVTATDVSVCDGTAVTISATANGGAGAPYTYTWNNGAVGASQTVTPTGATSIDYTVTANDNGCSVAVTDVATVTIHPLAVGFITPGSQSGCEDFTTTFTGLSNSGVSYDWNFGDGTGTYNGNPMDHTFTNAGTYSISLDITTADGCVTTVTNPNSIQVNPAPTAAFDYTPKPVLLSDPTVTFVDQSIGGNDWLYDFIYINNTIPIYTDTLQNPTFVYPDTGIYVVQQVVFNSFGCTDTTYRNIEVEPEYVLYAPNAFTPTNHDGVNDVFMVKGIGIDPDNFTMMIFDRWGNEIFKTTDLAKGWDGRANGGSNVAQIDVYVWKVITKDYRGDEHSYTGHVSLVK